MKPTIWHDFTAPTTGHDLFRRVYSLNIARPVSRWRRIRAWLGWHERDSAVSGFRNKPVLVRGRGVETKP